MQGIIVRLGYGLLIFIYALLDKLFLSSLIIRDECQERLRNHDSIEVSGGNQVEQPFTVLRATLVLARCQYIGRGIKPVEVFHKILQRGVLNNNHRLAGQSQAAHLHRGGYHREGLARSDLVCQQSALVQATLNGFGLMLTQGNGFIRAGIMGHKQILAVFAFFLVREERQAVLLQPVVVIPIIIYTLQFAMDSVASVNVLDELVGYFHNLLRGSLRLCFIGYAGRAFSGRSIRGLLIVNLRLPLVQGIYKQVNGTHPFSLVQS